MLTHAPDAVTPVAVVYLPAAQSRHVAAAEAPNVVEYLPAPQSVHWPEPAADLFLYVPDCKKYMNTRTLEIFV
jgi:hypothetical protein